MAKEDQITRVLAITDQALRLFFPNDFHKRCMYASFGIAALLEDVGVLSKLIAGDFLCTVVSADSEKMSLQGFGTSNVSEEVSHVWVEAQDYVLDLGPMYLPYESPFAAAPIPILRWPVLKPLPAFIAYRERLRYGPDIELADSSLQKRKMDFVSHCRMVNGSCVARAAPPTWQLRDPQSLQYAARRGDPWALASIEFMAKSMRAQFP